VSERWQLYERILGRFEIREIKRGGMGIVFLCYHLERQIPVALKTFQDHYLTDERSKQRFLEEADAWLKLGRHTNIVEAYYVELIHYRPYIVMEYVAGDGPGDVDLASRISGKRLKPEEAMRLAIQVCDAMIHAAERFSAFGKTFVHRDLKPANILIAHGGIVKLTDFGLIHALSDEPEEIFPYGPSKFTKVGKICGTPAYMSPEQTRGETNPDVSSDIYSFGCVMYEMLTGRPPFVCDDFYQYLYCHRETAPEPVDSVIANVPESLSRTVMRCLAKDPAARWSSFVELRRQLEHLYGKSLPAAQAGPEDLIRLNQIGYSLSHIGKHEEAARVFERALALPDLSEAERCMLYSNRGLNRERSGDWDGAMEDYTRAIDLQPENPVPYVGRANIRNNQGDLQEAIEDYNAAISRDPEDGVACLCRGICNGRLGRWEDARSDFDAAIRNGRNEAFTNRGAANLNLGRIEEATSDFSRAIDLNPLDTVAYVNRAFALEILGRPENAMRDLEAAIQLDPEYPVARLNRGMNRLKAGDAENALEDLEIARKAKTSRTSGPNRVPYALGAAELHRITLLATFGSGLAYMRTSKLPLAVSTLRAFLDQAGPDFSSQIRAAEEAIRLMGYNLKE